MDDYSQYMEKTKSVPNHQPVVIVNPNFRISWSLPTFFRFPPDAAAAQAVVLQIFLRYDEAAWGHLKPKGKVKTLKLIEKP